MKSPEDIIPQLRQTISDARKKKLDALTNYIVQTLEERGRAQLVFICTHNSRRSQLAQTWATFFAQYYNVPVNALSGGTVVTAVHPNVEESLQRNGFQLEKEQGGADNAHYTVWWSEEHAPFTLYSKQYSDAVNPQSHFAAVMTCSHADDNCPFIPGAEARISLNYEDPKVADGTKAAPQKYDACSLHIATELNYVFSKIK